MYQKTAKDIAFDKERAKLQKQKKELQETVYAKEKMISELENKINELNILIVEKDNQIEKLLSCLNLSEEELKNMVEKDKNLKEFTNLLSIMRKF